ncbi:MULTISPECIES: hypothetical protein [Frankia]|uniref:hypothetical protein n=1 Tax=Frankia TaxID=1854 RepID=UPI0021BE77CD|nr:MULTISPECIES: hypothetical protein [Frankia]
MTTENPTARSVAAPPANVDAWTGRWQWNAATARFDNPVHQNAWAAQLKVVTVDGDRLNFRIAQTFGNGKKRSFTFDGAFDGRPRPMIWDDDGSPALYIAFSLLRDDLVSDAFYEPNGLYHGSEHFVLSGDNMQLYGRSNTGGIVYDYFEEWDRIG